MRADRLVSLVLLLRQRGKMSASQLATELEVSTRTVLRDIEALSTAGVPVYSDRGRHGGFSILPGFRTELTALNHSEALALLATESGGGAAAIGLSPARSSAIRKIIDALPDAHQTQLDHLSQRVLVEPEIDLLSRRADRDEADEVVVERIRRSVLDGFKVRFRYAAPDQEPRWHSVDPIGLVTARGQTYLLATKMGAERTYRLSRVLEAEVLPQAADRPDRVDLVSLWTERAARFLAEGHIRVAVRVDPSRAAHLLSMARAVVSVSDEADGWSRYEVMFEDLRHATWAVWQLDTDAEVLEPPSLRAALRARLSSLSARYEAPGSDTSV